MWVVWDHSFTTFAKFSENPNFLTPDTRTYLYVSGGKKFYFLNKWKTSTVMLLYSQATFSPQITAVDTCTDSNLLLRISLRIS